MKTVNAYLAQSSNRVATLHGPRSLIQQNVSLVEPVAPRARGPDGQFPLINGSSMKLAWLPA